MPGMGRDGTLGGTQLAKSNGCIYVQDPNKCLVKSMTSSAIEAGIASKILDLNELSYHINKGIFSFKKIQNSILLSSPKITNKEDIKRTSNIPPKKELNKKKSEQEPAHK